MANETIPIASQSPKLTINHLPPELLFEIFIVYQQAIRGDFDRRSPDSWACDYCWIKVAHICRRWREISLQFPTLWSSVYIPTAPPALVEELIRRSQPAPLSILSIRVSTSNIRYLALLLGHDGPLCSMRRLQICMRPHSQPEKEIESSDFSPLVLRDLEELKFSNHGTAQQSRPLIEFFATHPAQLRDLSLRDRRLFHESLTTLSLYGSSTSDGDIQWEEFYAALAPLYHLERLLLSHVLHHLSQACQAVAETGDLQ